MSQAIGPTTCPPPAEAPPSRLPPRRRPAAGAPSRGPTPERGWHRHHRRYQRAWRGLARCSGSWLARAGSRCLDASVSGAALAALLLSPVGILCLLGIWRGRVRLHAVPRLGKGCRIYREYRLAFGPDWTSSLLRRLGVGRAPALVNVLAGDMALVGPRPVAPGQLSVRQRLARRRWEVRPGLVCLWWIRCRANIGYGDELEADREYVDSYGLWTDVGLVLRSAVAACYGRRKAATGAETVDILGIPVDNLTMEESLAVLSAWLEGDTPRQVQFLNAHCANVACGDSEYRRILCEAADLCLADGVGVRLAARIAGREIRQNVNGTDLFPRLCDQAAQRGQSLFLLGGHPGVADGVAAWVGRHHPGVRIAGVQHGYFTPAEEEEVVRRIAASGAHVLLVALGVPRQEKWIDRHLASTGVHVAMGVGGLFDFYSGRLRRAPAWVREAGMEWAYRLLQEPGRMWRRYLVGNVLFLTRVAWQPLGGRVAGRAAQSPRACAR